jgi:hypothetical protein
MERIYQYKGFAIDVTVETNFTHTLRGERTSIPAYVVVIKIERTGAPVAFFSPLRLGDSSGKAFSTEADALMTGYSAAQRIIDDLLAVEMH